MAGLSTWLALRANALLLVRAGRAIDGEDIVRRERSWAIAGAVLFVFTFLIGIAASGQITFRTTGMVIGPTVLWLTFAWALAKYRAAARLA
jgi:hypothetical protein